MSKIVIPFEPRARDVASIVESETATPQIPEFPARTRGLTNDDAAALEALAPTLEGVWTCEILVNNDGDRWAVFKDHHARPLKFFVSRTGNRLRLYNMEGEAVVIHDNMGTMATMLSDVIGQRNVPSG